MAIFHLKGRITPHGQLEVDLPDGLPPGEIEITIEMSEEQLPWELRPWTDQEIEELMTELSQAHPKTGAEIVAHLDEMGSTGWEHIEDGAAWVADQRRKHQEFRSCWPM